MQIAAKPHNERQRLESLYELDILNEASDRTLDELTELASRLCDTPVSLVTLIDDQRQFFKSRQGLDVMETPREISFCAHAILNDDLMIVEDTHQDPRFFDNPLVTGPYQVRFYAGFPLSTDNSKNLGTLCVVDMKPRKLTAYQLRALEILGHQAAQHLELLRYLKRLDSRNRELRAIMQNISQGIFTLNQQGLTQSEHSAQLPQILGLPSIEANMKLDELLQAVELSATQKEAMQKNLIQVFQSQTPSALLQKLPDEFKVKPNQVVEVKWDPIFDRNHKLERILVALKDVTQPRLLQEQRMALSEKMAAIGELVYDLSHELRNAQTASSSDLEEERRRFSTLFGNYQLSDIWQDLERNLLQEHESSVPSLQDFNSIMRSRNLPSQQKKLILTLLSLGLPLARSQQLNEKIQGMEASRQQAIHSLFGLLESFVYMWKSARRTSELTQSVLDHARNDEQKSFVKVGDLVESSLTLLQKKSKALGVKTNLQIDAAGQVYANKSEINQVLLNLFKNALEAFEQSDVPSQNRTISIRQAYEGPYLSLSVEDNAGGIAPEILGRIFERRFSTKGEKGNGLGLYLAQKLVIRNSGSLSVRSSEGKTCFTLCLLKGEAVPDPAVAS